MFSNSKILPGFVVFEGLDGAGTTTQLELAGNRLVESGVLHHITFEPTRSATGKLIRQVLSGEIPYQRSTLARLFAADRCEHLYGTDGIANRTERGELVICDRYLFSSLAYQGSELGIDEVWKLNGDFPLPEALIFLDVPPEEGEQRYSRRDALEIYENIDVQKSVRDRYRDIFSQLGEYSDRLHIIDSRSSISEIAEEVWRILSDLPIVKG